MCRIAYIPSPEGIGIKALSDLFAMLEKKQGGDGNGLAYYHDGELRYEKGVKKSAAYLASIASVCTEPVLFHTRLASSGGVMDALCQPIVKDGVAFAHNGTWHGWTDVAQELIFQEKLNANYPINDSVTAAAMALGYGRYSLETIKTGVFVLMEDGVAVLHLRTGTFRWSEDLGIYASCFEAGVDSESIADKSIATLLPDGPEFECGGYYKARTVRHVAGVNIYQAPYYKNKSWDPDKKQWVENEGQPEEEAHQTVSQKPLWQDEHDICDGCPDQDAPPCNKGWLCPHPAIRDADDAKFVGEKDEEDNPVLAEMRRILGEERAGGPAWAKDLSDELVRKYYYQDHEEPPNLEGGPSPGEELGAAKCRELLDLTDTAISDADVIALYDDYCKSGNPDTDTMRKLLKDHFGDPYAVDIDQLSDDEVLAWFADVEDGVFEFDTAEIVTAQDIRNQMLATHGEKGLAIFGARALQEMFDSRCKIAGVPPCQYKQ